MGIWNSSKWESGTAQCGSLEQLSVGIWKTVPLESGTLSPWNPINGPLKWSHGMPGVFSTFSLYDARHSIAIFLQFSWVSVNSFAEHFAKYVRKLNFTFAKSKQTSCKFVLLEVQQTFTMNIMETLACLYRMKDK